MRRIQPFRPAVKCNLGHEHETCEICDSPAELSSLPAVFGRRIITAPVRACHKCHSALIDLVSDVDKLRALVKTL